MVYFEEKKYQLEFVLEKNKKYLSLTNDDVMGHPVPEELPSSHKPGAINVDEGTTTIIQETQCDDAIPSAWYNWKNRYNYGFDIDTTLSDYLSTITSAKDIKLSRENNWVTVGEPIKFNGTPFVFLNNR